MLTFALLFSASCRQTAPVLAECDGDSAVRVDTGRTETGDTSHTGGDTGTHPSEPGRCAELPGTRCPAWAGIPDVMARSATFEGSFRGSAGLARIRTMSWLDFSYRASDSPPDGGMLMSIADLSETDAHPEGKYTDELSFACDEQGLWLKHEHFALAYTYGQSDTGWWPAGTSGVQSAVGCDDTPLLILPCDLEVGKTWTTSCTGYTYSYDDPAQISGDVSFTVTEIRQLDTPAGSFEAAHVVMGPGTDEGFDEPMGRIAAVSLLLGSSEFWVAKDVGFLQFSNFTRTQSD